MELKDTIQDMLSDDWSLRLKAEFMQVHIRRMKLKDYMRSVRKAYPDSNMFQNLEMQYDGMLEYEQALFFRIKDNPNLEHVYDAIKKHSML